MHFDTVAVAKATCSLQRPWQVAKVNRATQASICFQEAHYDSHCCFIITGTTWALIVVYHVYAYVRVLTCGRRLKTGQWSYHNIFNTKIILNSRVRRLVLGCIAIFFLTLVFFREKNQFLETKDLNFGKDEKHLSWPHFNILIYPVIGS